MRIKVLRGIACVSALAIVGLLAACGSAPVGPGYYRVERGDTLSHIAERNHTSVAALSRWNNLSDPNNIDVGQVLRVAPPEGGAPVRTAGVDSGSASAPPPRASTRPAPATSSAGSASTYAPKPPPASARIALIWPARGPIVGTFGVNGNKGIDIAGSDGTPVVAAANGTVVYAGDRLRGYGMLLIVKHNADFLTAYAHNRALLVREGDTVKQGQKIAEMGNTDADRMELHFELRYAGTSIDPTRYLPPR
ncbi:peptidoglycan DD-metalloendopeptidase family protein [Pararobbsia silviterrae]|uniref:LysM peptidoglycan-binding domain-containing protein n=1 Tax=Pararobbsia silviterrae TaxID=1792498 RepID=A0A494X7S1_9BURK|nr:peptidoglycan DD-metalloendopeptidase family protein [Pararobbsia silviterrae]RKP43773.1 LysM peptidoglycan-binding domain-containing protein [Pararobbsia silviterrae]